jgi:hypothetical protein
MRKSVKRAVGAGILGGAAYAAWRAWNARMPERSRNGVEWSTAPFPFPPEPRPAAPKVAPKAAPRDTTKAKPARTQKWTEPNADGSCPKTHPIKAKLASGIYHAPGGSNYARTKPDRCYVDEAAAAADGLRPSKV